MGNVYSMPLLTADGSSGASALVPDGFVWVVKEIGLWFGGTLGSELYVTELASGITLLDVGAPTGNPSYFALPRNICIPSGGGRGLGFHTADTWDVYISGYQLTLP